MRVASIDIGTNSILLLVAEFDAAGGLTVLAEEEETPRIGRRVDDTGRIDTGVFPVVTSILDRYLRRASDLGADRVAACATSAVRDAVNRHEIVDRVRLATGIVIRVITGIEESELTYIGAGSGLPPGAGDPIVLDIGGGSTELCYRQRGQVNGGRGLKRYSFDVGSVRLSERFFREVPAGRDRIESARMRVLEDLAEVVNTGFSGYALVGVSGTVTTLAALLLGLDVFDGAAIEGFMLSREKLSPLCARLLSSAPGEIRAMSGVTAGREDILGAGALILLTVMEHFGFPAVRVSTRGLRYGIAVREWERWREERDGPGKPGSL